MPASQSNISENTPMGANLISGGATFRVWAPGAKEVYVVLDDHNTKSDANKLIRHPASGHWCGFIPGIKEDAFYRFWVVGSTGEGYKRDPYARELEMQPSPGRHCILRDPQTYPWKVQDFKPPMFNDLIVYQFHIGVFYAKDANGKDIRKWRTAKFLDVLARIEYLADLGVNAIMPLPFLEFHTMTSLGYNETDLFSPEMDYAVADNELDDYIKVVNSLLQKKGHVPLVKSQLRNQSNQLKTFIDIAHLYGLAVISDVVYNHAGGDLDDESIHFFDRNSDIYFLSKGWAGGLVFAFWDGEVRQFLINNAKMFIEEYHVDGFRFDEVRVIDENGGWQFCQDLTNTINYIKPNAIKIAEYWNYSLQHRCLAVLSPSNGMGFDAGYCDKLRDNVRSVIQQASQGGHGGIKMDSIFNALYTFEGFPAAWKQFQCLENHDISRQGNNDAVPRIARLSDGSNPRSWYARSRARVATGLLMTAPGIPMVFMGQEFLEDKLWSDSHDSMDNMIWWDGLEGGDKNMSDFHAFTRDLIWLRRRYPALRGERINVFHVHNDNRVIAFHRWLDTGNDVVIVVSLSEYTYYNNSYRIGFPAYGWWHEVFNSDFYDNFPNPICKGNNGGVTADGQPMDKLPYSGAVTLPANSIIVFAREK
ncbi:MAG: alpha amylase C-terminal domain-containing protein [Nitrospirae bacterium]|nr:alpha amylase C-terminal domain-containing protein [Nitrospirota bacterium]